MTHPGLSDPITALAFVLVIGVSPIASPCGKQIGKLSRCHSV